MQFHQMRSESRVHRSWPSRRAILVNFWTKTSSRCAMSTRLHDGRVENFSQKIQATKVLDIASERRFEDFRVMFDKMDKEIDAVVISTPDHLHFHPGWSAMVRGKHTFIEKPLAHNVWETRQLTNLARKKTCHSDGVKRHAFPSVRKGVSARSGAHRSIKSLLWTNSPRAAYRGTQITALPTKQLNWDLGGPAESYHSPGDRASRFFFWWKYGSGETGNNGCHVSIFRIMRWVEIPYESNMRSERRRNGPERSPTRDVHKAGICCGGKRPAVTVHWIRASRKGLDQIFRDYKLDEKQIGMIACWRFSANQHDVCR